VLRYYEDLPDAERRRLHGGIRSATSLEEIIRLEKELDEGRLPAGIHGGDGDGDDDDAMAE